MTIPTDDLEIAAWIRDQLAALDVRPRERNWRYKALGMTYPQAFATADREVTFDFKLPVGEMRVVRRAAEARDDMPLRTYLRRALGTVLVACDGYHPDDVPYLTKGGLIGPR